jgi:16S rRNA (cytosine967-C5)-methyltransferase
LTRDSLAVAIEALSWMAYEGIGERTALFRAADQLSIKRPNELRLAHKLIMETTRFQNRLESLIRTSLPEQTSTNPSHGVTSFLKILAYLKFVENMPDRDLEQNVRWARQILGWEELLPYEKQIAIVASGTLRLPSLGLNEFERLAFETCNPAWYVEKTIRAFGRAFALKILNRNLTLLPRYVRLNRLKVLNEDRANEIAAQVGGTRLSAVEDVLRIDRTSRALVRSNSFISGEVALQDLSSIITSFVASPMKGDFVLDLCAAPGNKTSHLAAIMRNEGEICSVDLSKKRLSQWKIEIGRTGVTIAHQIRGDAKHIPAKNEANVILVDPPCSNTGVFARNPSAKWNTSPSEINEFAIRQHSILNAAAAVVTSNGILVYCTCSVLPEENELVIEDFLRRHQSFKLVPQRPNVGSPGLRGLDLCQRFYPHIHDCNGYFIAKLQRTD